VRWKAAGACWQAVLDDKQIDNLDGLANHGSG
jgi:hypothetical protein